MAIIHLADMLGHHTLQDWLTDIRDEKVRFRTPLDQRLLHESDRAMLLYCFSQGVSPFSLHILLHDGNFYIVSGDKELYTLSGIAGSRWGVHGSYWTFSDPPLSHKDIWSWNNISEKEKILSTHIPCYYMSVNDEEDFQRIIRYYDAQ